MVTAAHLPRNDDNTNCPTRVSNATAVAATTNTAKAMSRWGRESFPMT
ncbi:hypothetical protein ACFYZ3_16285 [Streptomyces sp. NPDC001599]